MSTLKLKYPIPVLDSLNPPPGYHPHDCDCARFHGGSKSVNCHEDLVPNTPDPHDSGHLLTTNEGIKHATVTRIAFLTSLVPVTVDPR